MSDHRTNEERTHIIQMRKMVKKIKTQTNEKFPILLGKKHSGFRLLFADGFEIDYEGGLMTAGPLVELHGKILKARAF